MGADEEDADGVGGHGAVLSGGAAGGGDGRLEIQQLSFEAVEVGALPFDRLALLGQERREVEVDAPALQAQAREPSGILGGEAQPAQGQHQAKPGKVDLVVVAVAVGLSPGRGEDAFLFIPADRRGGHTRTRRRALRSSCRKRKPSSRSKVKAPHRAEAVVDPDARLDIGGIVLRDVA